MFEDFKLSSIFDIENYEIITISTLQKQLCCLRSHYQFIIQHLSHSTCRYSEDVECKELISFLECALELIKDLEMALQQDWRTKQSVPSKYVLYMAKCLFDYLGKQKHLAILDADGTDVDIGGDYGSVCSYGIYLHNKDCVKELRYLIECGGTEVHSM